MDCRTDPSIFFCNQERFIRYGSFAALPFHVTVLDLDSAERQWHDSMARSTHLWSDFDKARMERAIHELGINDDGFFTIDDYQLFLPMHAPNRPLTDEQIEKDREELLDHIALSSYVKKSHAESMLKAIEYWKLHYDTKHREWMDRYDRAWGYDSDSGTFNTRRAVNVNEEYASS